MAILLQNYSTIAQMKQSMLKNKQFAVCVTWLRVTSMEITITIQLYATFMSIWSKINFLRSWSIISIHTMTSKWTLISWGRSEFYAIFGSLILNWANTTGFGQTLLKMVDNLSWTRLSLRKEISKWKNWQLKSSITLPRPKNTNFRFDPSNIAWFILVFFIWALF